MCQRHFIYSYETSQFHIINNNNNTQMFMCRKSTKTLHDNSHPIHWVPEQLNIKAVTGACNLIDGCSLALCSATVSVVSAGICHRNEVNSIA